jgi:hypothetical protein
MTGGKELGLQSGCDEVIRLVDALETDLGLHFVIQES